ncbi:MAG: hypothetical protein U1G07_12940 [Verrucomicrobiota bacterium]
MTSIPALASLVFFGAVSLWMPQARAFPPAPHHLVYGLVRDELGNPLAAPGALVLLEVDGVVQARGVIAPKPQAGLNYELTIPLDSSLAVGVYKPTALRPTVPFRVRVRIGAVTYLPIQMAGARQFVTTFAGSSRLDLTLGVDADGDGLPDAWEQALIAALGGVKSLADIEPGGDDDGDGLTNLQEYIAGTYAFDPEDGFALAILETSSEGTLVEFTTLPGRTYTVRDSTDLKTWSSAGFRIVDTDHSGEELRAYSATDVRLLRVRVTPPAAPNAAGPHFFNLMVQ